MINEISDNFKKEISKIYVLLENDDFESTIDSLNVAVQDSVKAYGEKLQRYPVHVVQTKNESLMRRLKELVEPLFDIYCEKIEKKSLRIFEHDLNSSKSVQLSTILIDDSIERAATFYRTSLQRKITELYFLLISV